MYGLYMLRILPLQKPDKAFLRCAWGSHTRRRRDVLDADFFAVTAVLRVLYRLCGGMGTLFAALGRKRLDGEGRRTGDSCSGRPVAQG